MELPKNLIVMDEESLIYIASGRTTIPVGLIIKLSSWLFKYFELFILCSH